MKKKIIIYFLISLNFTFSSCSITKRASIMTTEINEKKGIPPNVPSNKNSKIRTRNH